MIYDKAGTGVATMSVEARQSMHKDHASESRNGKTTAAEDGVPVGALQPQPEQNATAHFTCTAGPRKLQRHSLAKGFVCSLSKSVLL